MTDITSGQKPKAAKKLVKTSKPAPVSAKKPAAKKVASQKAVVSSAVPTKAKHKLVRDSFIIPKFEYAVLGALKERAANLKRPAKKSELLRAGISALNTMSDRLFLAALSSVPSLQTGRPSKASAS